ncbi:MAG: Osmosensitive channel histidine kinase KdpD [Labilithrix sp.]|nr:Osmosensitive channel histidine kinase KdpD [Labilithrix sp.]
MTERPDPDALLARIREDEQRDVRGKLTLFFGAAPGVGKTYAMLESARLERADGRDVVVGLVETHGRYDTGALLLGLEILPRRKVEHRGVVLEELDVDACLARRPGVVLVDELAHTNAPGSRHAKRWQDVDDLLDAGLDVYTTMNVQHLESLVDVVAQITHVVVKETVPDSVLDRASEMRLVDVTIEELLARLKEGKVYVPAQAERAGKHFFRPGNLIALRELALRVTAQVVDAQMRKYRDAHGIDRTWAASERLLVCVSPSPSSAKLVRGAKRLAVSLHADWIAAFVETSASLGLTAGDRQRVADHLDLARTLGAESMTVTGESGASALVALARRRNVTRIVVGKPTHASWRDRLQGSFVEQLVRLSGEIDVHVMKGADETERKREASALRVPSEGARSRLVGFATGALLVAGATLIGDFVFGRTQLADVVMVYLFGTVLVSLRFGLAPSLATAALSVVAFDFFFIPPYFTFAVADLRHIVTFAVMMLVATVITGLTGRVRGQVHAAREREMRTASLFALSRQLASAKTRHEILTIGTKQLHDVFGGRTSALLQVPGQGLRAQVQAAWTYVPADKDLAVAEWVWEHGRPAGLGTDTLPSATALYVPLEGSSGRLGVLGVAPLAEGPAGLTADDRLQLDAFVGQVAAALDRVRLAGEAQDAQVRVEAEQLRSSLLSSVSHDLRTPLAVITGTATALENEKLDPEVRRELSATIVEESERLNRLVRNLLDMTRVEAGALRIAKDWQPVEEVVGAAIAATTSVLGSRPLTVHVPPELLAPFDAVLVQQVLVNLLENAAKYAGVDAGLVLEVRGSKHTVEVTVKDRGPGLPPGDEGRIFDKFYRAEKGKGGGVGLGLTICRAIVDAHGGRIWAENRRGGGASFHFTLPLTGEPPLALPPERADA